MAKFEKTQPGNPHGLTVNQHIFPRSCISRFENADDRVEVKRVGNFQNTFTAVAEDPMFCARRVWDQRTETLHSKSIESTYARIADELAEGRLASLDSNRNEAISHFYDLCKDRYEATCNPHPDVKVGDVLGDPQLDKDKQERLERLGMLFVRPDGTMPGRMLAGIKIAARGLYSRRVGSYPSWGVFRAQDGEFVVPDNFMVVRCIPVTPSIFLFADSADHLVGFEAVAELNAIHIARAAKFCFSRNFDSCPVVKRTIPSKRFSFQIS